MSVRRLETEGDGVSTQIDARANVITSAALIRIRVKLEATTQALIFALAASVATLFPRRTLDVACAAVLGVLRHKNLTTIHLVIVAVHIELVASESIATTIEATEVHVGRRIRTGRQRL